MTSYNNVYLTDIEIESPNQRIGSISHELNTKIPFYNIHIKTQGKPDIKAYLGLDSETDAVLKVSHSDVGSEVMDFIFQTDLRSGNSINTQVEWRSTLSDDIKSFFKRTAVLLERIQLHQLSDDTNFILKGAEECLNLMSGELIFLSDLTYTSILDPLKLLTNYLKTNIVPNFSFETQRILQYYLNGVDYALKFR